MAALNLWLGSIAEQQVARDLDLSARRTIGLAEGRLHRAVAALDELAARGVDSCRAAHVDALRNAAFVVTPAKEFSVVAPDGRTLCSDYGSTPDHRTLIASEPLVDGGQHMLDLVRLGGNPQHWVRIRRPGTGQTNGVAVLIPTELLTPNVSTQGGPLNALVRVSARGGMVVASSGSSEDSVASGEGSLKTVHESKRYRLQISLTASRDDLAATHGELRTFGVVSSGSIAILILLLAAMLPRRQRVNPVDEIERALEAGEFVPYYQPIVDIKSGRLRGAEVLIRWRKPDGSIAPPASFIPLAESSGLIIEMTRVLMQYVCREVGPAYNKRPQLRLGFNMAAQHFANEEVVDDVRKIFSSSPLRMSQVVLEVTERQPLDNLTETRRVIAALQGLGVRIAIDDVGTGHSGLSYMLKLGVDLIKIDKMFVDSVGTDRNSNAIIETLIDLAQNMRMEVIAEGVESFEQVVQLREMGIRAAQGYVFSPPLPGPSFLQLLEAIEPLNGAGADGADGGSVPPAKAEAA